MANKQNDVTGDTSIVSPSEENPSEKEEQLQDFRIYVYTHKDFENIPDNQHFKIIAQKNVEISPKPVEVLRVEPYELTNKALGYCECIGLFALYLGLVKNENGEVEKLPKYIGTSHYRSCLDFLLHKETFPDIEALFERYDVICAQPIEYKTITIREQYEVCHSVNHLDEVIEIIKYKEPDYYEAALACMKGTTFTNGNIYIMKREYFKEWLRFLYNVITEFDRRNNLHNQSDVIEFVKKSFINQKRVEKEEDLMMQSRLEGYLCERLSNIFRIRWFAGTRTGVVKLSDMNTKTSLSL